MLRRATLSDANAITKLALLLWPHHTHAQLLQEVAQLLAQEHTAFFLYFDQEHHPVAFAQCQLRKEYVEGTVHSPVGYLEGIFVDTAHRKQGIARRLLAACQDWAAQKGCREFASDCHIDNHESLAFHQHAGFTEAARIVCFTKKIQSETAEVKTI